MEGAACLQSSSPFVMRGLPPSLDGTVRRGLDGTVRGGLDGTIRGGLSLLLGIQGDSVCHRPGHGSAHDGKQAQSVVSFFWKLISEHCFSSAPSCLSDSAQGWYIVMGILNRISTENALTQCQCRSLWLVCLAIWMTEMQAPKRIGNTLLDMSFGER